MDITRGFLRAKRPCTAGFRWFLRHFENDSNYPDLLDALVDTGRVADARRALAQFGPTSDVRTVEAVGADSIVFAGTLGGQAQRSIQCARDLRAARDVRCGNRLRMGADAFIGLGLDVKGDVQGDAWEASARVSAQRKPDRHISGCWASAAAA